MEQYDKSRAQRSVMFFGIVVVTMYVICVTAFMVILCRLTVEQSMRIQALETVTGELTARVDILQNKFTAQSTNKKSVGEADRLFADKSFKTKTKVSLFHESLNRVCINFVFKQKLSQLCFWKYQMLH